MGGTVPHRKRFLGSNLTADLILWLPPSDMQVRLTDFPKLTMYMDVYTMVAMAVLGV